MSREPTELEMEMYKMLKESYSADKAEHLRDLYRSARTKLLRDVLDLTTAAEPHMTDHSVTHVIDVMEKACRLLPPVPFQSHTLSAADAYTLCLSILFHDAGMVYGRSGHERRITQVYDWVRKECSPPLQEKALVYRIATAHTGRTREGSADTIGEVPPTMDLDGDVVQPRELAAILRFADELAEGPRRTSSFMTEELGLPSESIPYHKYASITNVHVDRAEGRIVLTYRFDIKPSDVSNGAKELTTFLDFVLRRAIKVDTERRYARHYSTNLVPFNRTEVTLNFWVDGQPPIDLGTLELSAKNALTQHPPTVEDIDPEYRPADIIARIQREIGDE